MAMTGQKVRFLAGDVKCVVYSNGVRPPKDYAESVTRKILYVGKDLPPLAVEQMNDFKKKLEWGISQVIQQAVSERQDRDAFLAEGHGGKEVADIIRKDSPHG